MSRSERAVKHATEGADEGLCVAHTTCAQVLVLPQQVVKLADHGDGVFTHVIGNG